MAQEIGFLIACYVALRCLEIFCQPMERRFARAALLTVTILVFCVAGFVGLDFFINWITGVSLVTTPR